MPTFSNPRIVASVLQDGPRVQMIFALRKGAVSGVQRDGEELSDMGQSRDIVNGRRSHGESCLPSESFVSVGGESLNDII